MNTAAPTLPAPKSRARRYVSRGIKSMLIGAVIALVFTLVFSQDFWHSLVEGVVQRYIPLLQPRHAQTSVHAREPGRQTWHRHWW